MPPRCPHAALAALRAASLQYRTRSALCTNAHAATIIYRAFATKSNASGAQSQPQPPQSQESEAKSDAETESESESASQSQSPPDSESAQSDADAEAERVRTDAASSRHALIGAMCLIAAAAAAGYGVVHWRCGGLSGLYSMLVINQLKQGPDSLLSPGVSESINMAAVSSQVRLMLVSESALLDCLVNALSAGYAAEVQGRAASLFLILTQDSVVCGMLRKDPRLVRALFEAAMRPGATKDVAAMSFAALKQLASDDKDGTVRAQLLNKAVIYGLSRAVRARNPEVAGSASELLSSLVPTLNEHGVATFGWTEAESRSVLTALANLGHMFAEQNLPHQAIACFEPALALDPANFGVLSALGLEYLKTAEVDKAAKVLRRVIQIDPTNLDAAFHLHRAQITATATPSESQLLEAVAALKPAIRAAVASGVGANSMLSPAYHLVCKAFERLGRVQEAAEEAAEWAVHCPQDAVAHFTHGRLQLAAGHAGEANHALDIAQRKDPSRPETAYQRALARVQLGDVVGAQQACSQASALLGPRHPVELVAAIERLRAELWELDGQFDAAADARLRVAHIKPHSAVAKVRAANALQRTGKNDEAAAQLAQAIALWTEQAKQFPSKAQFFEAKPFAKTVLDTLAHSQLTPAAQLQRQIDQWNDVWTAPAKGQ